MWCVKNAYPGYRSNNATKTVSISILTELQTTRAMPKATTSKANVLNCTTNNCNGTQQDVKRLLIVLSTLILLLVITPATLRKSNGFVAIAATQLPKLLYRPTAAALMLPTQQDVLTSSTSDNVSNIKSLRKYVRHIADKIVDNGEDVANDYQMDTNASSTTNNHCPEVCICLDSFFDCGNKDLTHVPNIPDYVQQLNLKRNLLNDNNVVQLQNKPKLEKLTLKRNRLENMPIFSGLSGLKQLNLAYNQIRKISRESLAVLPKLKTLDLSRNQLHVLEYNFFPSTNNLANLFLNGNKITDINEQAFESLSDLVDLELNNNRLTTLPVGIFKTLNKLRKLSLNSNRLVQINWSTFKGLSALHSLSLKGNKIRTLQDGVFHILRSIESINLDHNNISSLNRQGLFNLTKLQHLSLSNNIISKIELDTWEFTQSLVSLDLSSNRISDFKPQHLECLHHLNYLNLGYNNIQYLSENTFDCVRNLEELNLCGNKLAWNIEDSNSSPVFKTLRKLKHLNLIETNLKQISSKAFSGLSSLEILQLKDNPLATVQTGAFGHMPQLKQLNINTFNFICDCENHDFQLWLHDNPMKHNSHNIQIFCMYPRNLGNQSLLSILSSELPCVDNPKPLIIFESENQLAVKGANLTLECIINAPSNISVDIKWRLDNHLIGDVPNRSTSEMINEYNTMTNRTNVTSYLHLYNVDYERAGRFQCVASNVFGSAYSQKIKLSIGIHPSFVQTPSNLSVDTGDTVRLVCSATGDPVPEMSLQKFGGSDFPAATERRLQVIRKENAFVILNAKLVDTGIYTCTAESAAGEIRVNASISVNDKPLTEIPHNRQETVQGESSVLKCLTADLVQPAYREWYKDNKPFHVSMISMSDRYYFTCGKELLVVVNSQPSDAGQYRCEITANTKTFVVETDLVVVKENFSTVIVIVIIILVTILCLLFGSLVVWFVMYLQRRKLPQNGSVSGGARVAVAPHRTLNNSYGSALEQTQLTNSTFLQQSQTSPYNHSLHHNYNRRRMQSIQKRPHSLADLDFHLSNHQHQQQQQQHPSSNRVIITQSPHYQPLRGDDEGFTLEFTHRLRDVEQKPDQLSNKDSGTGSDTAVKQSMEDFTLALLPRMGRYEASSVEAKTNGDNLQESPSDLRRNSYNALATARNYMADEDFNGDSATDYMAGEQFELCEIGEQREIFLKNKNNNKITSSESVHSGTSKNNALPSENTIGEHASNTSPTHVHVIQSVDSG